MTAPYLALVPPAADIIPSATDRTLAHGEMLVAVDAFAHAAESLHAAAFYVERAARRGGGSMHDLDRLERARELLREATRRVDAGILELSRRTGRGA